MTVEARYKIFGIPLGTQELFPWDGEMYLRFEIERTAEEDTIVAGTFRVISENEVAVFKYEKSPEDRNMYKRGKPVVLEGEDINKANLKTLNHILVGNV